MFKQWLRRLAGPDPRVVALEAELAGLRTQEAGAKYWEGRANELAEALAAAAHDESEIDDLRAQLATRDTLVAALLLKYGDTVLSGHLLAAAGGADFGGEPTAAGDGISLSLRGGEACD